MGLVIVIVVGAILGWLAAIVVDRDDRVGSAVCALSGVIGSVVAAELSGGVDLAVGVSPTQLLWGVAGAILVIVAINALAMTRWGSKTGSI